MIDSTLFDELNGFGMAIVKEEGAALSYSDTPDDYVPGAIEYDYLERRVPTELYQEISLMIDEFIRNKGYKAD